MADNFTGSVESFEADLAAFAAKLDIDLQLVVKRVVFDLFRRIIQKTPVDTGRAAGSWEIARDSSSTDTLPIGSYGKVDPYSLAIQQVARISFDPPEGIYWISNMLPYIQMLEFGLYPSSGGGKHSSSGKTIDGFSIQSPQGMVRVSLAEVETDIYEAEQQVAQ